MTKSKLGYLYNWRKPAPVKTKFKKVAKFAAPVELPASIDLRSELGPVFDQGQLGSCTANALASAWNFLEIQDRKNKVAAGEVFDMSKFVSASRLFIYYQERSMEGTIDQDSGAELSDGAQAMKVVGACDETVWPYAPAKFNITPSNEAYQEANKHQISDFAALSQDIESLKQCLAQGLPFVFGFQVYESFEDQAWWNSTNALMPMPNVDSEQLLGGHAQIAVGYDDEKQAVLVMNSWGTSFCMGGFYWMPYALISNSNLADECIVLSK